MTEFAAVGTVLRLGDGGQAFSSVGGTDVFTTTGHGFSDTNPVVVQGSSIPTGISEGTVYFVRDSTANTYKLAATSGGAAIDVGTGSGSIYLLTSLAQVRNISGPSMSVDTIDVTTHDSTNAAREFIAGLIDGGTVDLDLVFDPDSVTQAALRDDLEDRVNEQWFQIVWPDATSSYVTFRAIVAGLTTSAPHDGSLDASASLKVSKALVFI